MIHTTLLKNSVTLGIVIEMENIEASGAERTLANLAVFQQQLAQMAETIITPVTLRIVYDSNVFQKEDAERFICTAGVSENPLIEAATIGAPGIHYYEHKDIGAKDLDTDLVLMMDSDILIEDNWLPSLIAPFADETVNFVSGQTIIETPRFFDKIYALTVPGFPLDEPEGSGLRETTAIAANSFIFRRSKVAGSLFPRINAYRGHCSIAAQELIRSGETLHKQMDARAKHPSQDDLAGYFSRAFAEGCDAILLSRHNNRQTVRGRVNRSVAGSALRLVRGIWGMVKRSVTRHQRVGLPTLGIPVTMVLGTSYFALKFVGEVVTLINAPLAMRLSIAKQTH